MDVQTRLGSDIVMVLDECLEYPCSFERASSSLERTLRWAARSKAAYTWVPSLASQSAFFAVVSASFAVASGLFFVYIPYIAGHHIQYSDADRETCGKA